jgi:hypothetical protein
LKKNNQTLLKNFQSTPQPLIEIREQINQTLPEKNKSRSSFDPKTKNGEKTPSISGVNPLQPQTPSGPPGAHPDASDPAQKFSIGYAIAIENHFRFNQTLILFFQPDSA